MVLLSWPQNNSVVFTDTEDSLISVSWVRPGEKFDSKTFVCSVVREKSWGKGKYDRRGIRCCYKGICMVYRRIRSVAQSRNFADADTLLLPTFWEAEKSRCKCAVLHVHMYLNTDSPLGDLRLNPVL